MPRASSLVLVSHDPVAVLRFHLELRDALPESFAFGARVNVP